MPPIWIPPDVDKLVREYMGGDALRTLARRYGVDPLTIRKHLRRAGVETRDGSTANAVAWQRPGVRERYVAAARAYADSLTPEERHAIGMRAHPPGRIYTKNRHWREVNAAVREQRSWIIGRGEAELGEWLGELGLEVVPQLPVEGYNLDFGSFPLAVEVHTQSTHPLNARRPAYRRLVKLTDLGWNVVFVWMGQAHEDICRAAAEDVVAFHERTHRDPSTPGQYRVIRGSGEFVAEGRGDLDKFTRERPPGYRPNVTDATYRGRRR